MIQNGNEKIKILFIAKGPFGTLGMSATYYFPKVLHSLDFKVRVLSFNQKIEVGKIVEKIPEFVNERDCPLLWQRVKIVKNIIKEFNPDIVHMFTIPSFAYYPFLCTHVTENERPEWLIDIRSPPLRDRPVPFLLTPLYNIKNFLKQSSFSCITSHVRSSAQSFFRLPYKPLYEVPFGVDFQLIKKKEWPQARTSQHCLKFVYIGSHAKLRKLDLLIHGIHKAILDIEKRRSFTVDFIGAGEALDELQQLVKKLEISSVVRFLGIVGQEQLYKELLCKYDVGIGYVPYEQYMGSPALKVIEYMAAGLGVIASDTDGVKIHVRNRMNGMLFKNNPDSIAHTIKKIVLEGYPNNLLAEGLRTAQDCTWENVVQRKLIPVYESMLSKKASE